MGNLCSVWGSSRKGKPQVVVEETRPRRSFDEEGFIFRTLDENVEDLRLLSDGEKIKIQNHRILNRKKIEDGRKMSVELMPSGSEDVRWTQPLLDNFGFELSLTGEKFTSCHTEQERKKLKERASSEDIEEAFVIASKKKEAFVDLTDDEEIDVDCALDDSMSLSTWSDILVRHKPSNIGISREMMLCLRPGRWLNDEVVNLYLELLKEREKREPNKFLKCHFFNSFFYKRLTNGHDQYDFKAVRRWTTQRKIGYNLIDCDKIFVPIHKTIHWCLAIIHVKSRKFQYLDSMGGMDVEVLTLLDRYLKDEVKDKSNMDMDSETWKQEFVHVGILQKNTWDCGMFMLKYIDFYSRGLGLMFDQIWFIFGEGW
ncbi:Sentrin-specific protease 2 [Zostera marina]|uniref:Sentrin-specific protease 2 n=1 Tax=Zostera marina TaxID=29655 RepID=A0A0K9P5N5_ZOSMR|nr:Sentrin-specific protease 2 [Zostera marina]